MLNQIIYLCADCLSHNLFRRMCSKLYQHDLYLVTSLFNDFMKPFPSKSNLTEPKSNATTLNRKKELKMAKLSGVNETVPASETGRKYPKLMESVEIGRDCSKSNGSVWKRTELSEVKIGWKGPKNENTRNWWNRLKSDATVQNLTEASESGRNCPKLKSDGRARN